jgi:glutamate racemase
MIGVFDSGFGGLHVLCGIREHLPRYDYVYFGDSGRAPYGPRAADEVLTFTQQGVNFLFEQGAEMVLVACNTASSEALRIIQQSSEKKVLGVLVPLAEAAVEKSRSKRIGVIATEGTVKSNAFVREIRKLESGAEIFQKSCPGLVPLVEAGEEHSEQLKSFLVQYLDEVLIHKIDALVLGCTHYGILEPFIAQVVGPKVQVISDREVIGPKLKEYLARHTEIENSLSTGHAVQFYTSGDLEHFDEIGSRFFGASVKSRVAQIAI